jgi:hypothetical protein
MMQGREKTNTADSEVLGENEQTGAEAWGFLNLLETENSIRSRAGERTAFQGE